MGQTYFNQGGQSIDLNEDGKQFIEKFMPFWTPFISTGLHQLKTVSDIQMLIRVVQNYLHIQRLWQEKKYEKSTLEYYGFKLESKSTMEWMECELIPFLAESTCIYSWDERSEMSFEKRAINRVRAKKERAKLLKTTLTTATKCPTCENMMTESELSGRGMCEVCWTDQCFVEHDKTQQELKKQEDDI